VYGTPFKEDGGKEKMSRYKEKKMKKKDKKKDKELEALKKEAMDSIDVGKVHVACMEAADVFQKHELSTIEVDFALHSMQQSWNATIEDMAKKIKEDKK
jgi:hypothetical protein